MSDGTESAAGSHGTLKWAVRTVGITGFFGLAAVQYFAHVDRRIADPIRSAQAYGGRGTLDPVTTGSIGGSARAIRLDPCSIQAGARP